MAMRVGVRGRCRRAALGDLIAIIGTMALVVSMGVISVRAADDAKCHVRVASTDRTYAHLQAAVDAARPDDLVSVSGLCTGTTYIDKDLRIEGVATPTSDSPALSGGGKTRVVKVKAGVRVELRDLVIEHGSAVKGAGVLNRGTLTLRDVVVRENAGGRYGIGDAIHNYGTLTLKGTTGIGDNEVAVAVSNDAPRGVLVMDDASRVSGTSGHAGVHNTGTFTMNDTSSITDSYSNGVENGFAGRAVSTFTMNDSASIHGNRGAGVDNDGTFTMNDSASVHDNTGENRPEDWGFGVINRETHGVVTMNDDSTISGNAGGGLKNAGSLTMNDDSSITGNAGYGLYDTRVGALAGVECGPGGNVYDNRPSDCDGEPLPTASPTAEELARRPFRITGSLIEPRLGHTATLLADGRILVVGGLDGRGERLASAEVWDPATGEFTATGSLAEERITHTATLLRDGRVLVIGGEDERYRRLQSAELWDPSTGEFTPAGSLTRARRGHSATLLADGRVLVVGGAGNDGEPKRAELWDPATSEFTPAGSLAEPRAHHTAMLLTDGRVLVTGGPLAMEPVAAEVWDPATSSFSAVGSPTGARLFHTETPLPGGGILLVGGVGDFGYLAEADLWQPMTGETSPTGPPLVARALHSATLLSDGRVLVVGGANPDEATLSAEVWDPASGRFTAVGLPVERRILHTATLLTDGRVLLIGGQDVEVWSRGDEDVLASAEVWPSMPDPSALMTPAGTSDDDSATHGGAVDPV